MKADLFRGSDMSTSERAAPACEAVEQTLLGTWVTGWTLARETARPELRHGAFYVPVGWSTQKARYVFARCTEEVRRVAEEIDEPWVFIKVCASPEEVRAQVPARFVIDRLGYLMTQRAVGHRPVALPEDYRVRVEVREHVSVAYASTHGGDDVASGRVAMVGDSAIYDRIEVHPTHRRRGLGRAIMEVLEKAARERGARTGLLVATEEGRALYRALGWKERSLYTTAVIPASS